jgi:hypothetical protein
MLFLKRLALPVLLAGIALSGCIKSEQTFTIYPDGSGKVEARQIVLGMMAQMLRAGGGMPGMEGAERHGGPRMPQNPYDLLKKGVRGKVYWTDLKTEDGPSGEMIVSGTAYFENVNELRPENGSLAFEKTADGGFVFSMSQEIPERMKRSLSGLEGQKGEKPTPEEEAQRQQMVAMMKAMIAGFEMKISVVMPGEVKSAEGLSSTEGRRASLALGEQDVFDIMEKKKEPPSSLKVVSGPASASEKEVTEFKKALAAAKEQAEKESAKGEAPKKPEEKPEGRDKSRNF